LTVRALPPGVFYDQGTPAFGVRVGKHRRTWFVVRGEKRLRTTIGHYPALPLAEARRKALGLLGAAASVHISISYQDALQSFLEAKEKQLRPRSFAELKRTLKHFPFKGRLDKISHHDVAVAVEAIEAPSEGNHAFKDVRTFFNWCVPRYLKYSPCTGLKMPNKASSRSRVLTDAELKAVWTAAEQIDGHLVQ